MSEQQLKVRFSIRVEEKQPVWLISPDGYLPAWAVGGGVLFLDSCVTDNFVAGSRKNDSAWTTSWFMNDASRFVLSPLLWAYEQAYRHVHPVERFSAKFDKASKAFLGHGFRVFAHGATHQTLYEHLDEVIRPKDSQLRWLEYCAATVRDAPRGGQGDAVLAAAVEARAAFHPSKLGLSLFVGLLAIAGHRPSWRVMKGGYPYRTSAAANALVDLNAYTAYLALRQHLLDAHKTPQGAGPWVWFATADKPLAHVMLNSGCTMSGGGRTGQLMLRLGPQLAKELSEEGLKGFAAALDVLGDRSGSSTL